MYMKISKVRDVKTPIRANWGDALDFFIPNDFEPYRLFQNTNILIPSGIKIEVPFKYLFNFMNKSGIASKKELLVGAEAVDHGYSGEVHIDLHNVGNKPILLEPGMKIIQGFLIPIEIPSIIEVPEDELYQNIAHVSSRGEGGFGSTGTS